MIILRHLYLNLAVRPALNLSVFIGDVESFLLAEAMIVFLTGLMVIFPLTLLRQDNNHTIIRIPARIKMY
ncbi:MAG: hypothetical protein IPN49_12710 [Saprospiraceae bacterium]|nr:hypothetical protein [Saprospiraceae bacterium]